ncbi:sensor histidine kinase [Algoriphagus hitonicola]
MENSLQTVIEFIKSHPHIEAHKKEFLLGVLNGTKKELDIITFKLDRTEKVKRTTSILLEETIEELEQKRKAVEESNLALQKSLEDLKAAQVQLIQQEKLASLGQLTAGIAHEIKNPLNFVNNFSELSIELIEEIKEERAKKQESRDEKLVDEILEDIKANLEKVNEHGTRANGIVTSMLQHSRGGSGKMEPTDLNALISEYVNLSFHGMRAGKNPIDVDIELSLDPDLGNVPLIKEDFTR